MTKKEMGSDEVRRWLGLYFLLITVAFGGYVWLLSESPYLPIPNSEATATIQILLPVLIGQLTAIYGWYGRGNAAKTEKMIPIAPWVVKAPPILVAALLIVATYLMAWGNHKQWAWTLSPGKFRGLVVIAVSILNATSVHIVKLYFSEPTNGGDLSPSTSSS
jgi:H+/Cl- antiporter ClcA